MQLSLGITVDAGYILSSTDIVSIQAAVSACTDLSATLRGVLGVAIAGEASAVVSLAGLAEISAFLCADAGVSFAGE